jgi:hypothetical protein
MTRAPLGPGRFDTDFGFIYSYGSSLCGPIAQLVERYTGSVEVSGSTPLRSTIFAFDSNCIRFELGCAKIRINDQ